MGKLLIPQHLAEQQAEEQGQPDLRIPERLTYAVQHFDDDGNRVKTIVRAHMVGGDQHVVVFKAVTEANGLVTVRIINGYSDVELIEIPEVPPGQAN